MIFYLECPKSDIIASCLGIGPISSWMFLSPFFVNFLLMFFGCGSKY